MAPSHATIREFYRTMGRYIKVEAVMEVLNKQKHMRESNYRVSVPTDNITCTRPWEIFHKTNIFIRYHRLRRNFLLGNDTVEDHAL